MLAFDSERGTFTLGPVMPLPLAAYGSYENGHGQVHVLGGSTNMGVVNATSWFYP